MLYVQHWSFKTGYHQKGAEKFLAGGGDYPGVEMMSVFIKKEAICSLFYIEFQLLTMSRLWRLLAQLLHQ